MSAGETPPQYDQAQVEVLILEIGAEAQPSALSLGEMTAKVVADERDDREKETVERAVDRLREFGLLRARSDDVVELTTPALRAVALLLSGP